jgi:hypothetical protein
MSGPKLRNVPSLRDSSHNLFLPGTAVPGYRLCRPCGTRLITFSYPALPCRLHVVLSTFDKLRAGSAGLLRIAAYSSRRTWRGFWPRMRKLAAQPVAVANTAVPISAMAVASHSM